MSDASDSDDATFALDTGEELVLATDDAAAVPTRSTPSRPARPARPPRPSYRDRRAAGRLRARKVRRLVRHVEPWSVLKVSLIFYFCLWVILLVAGVILWSFAVTSGTVDNVENFIEELFALESFAFNADEIFRASAIGGLVLVVAGSGFTVLMAVLFNLISDVTGGVRFTVVEEETARPRPKRTRPRHGGPRPAMAPPPQSVGGPQDQLASGAETRLAEDNDDLDRGEEHGELVDDLPRLPTAEDSETSVEASG